MSGGHILFGLNVDLRPYSMKTRLLLKKTQIYEHSFGEKNAFFFSLNVMHRLLKRGVHQTPTSEKGSDSGPWWPLVSWREFSAPPPISKTLVMVQSDPTRTPTQLIRIDVR